MNRKNKVANRLHYLSVIDFIIVILFLSSLFLSVWSIEIYRTTFIDVKYLVITTVIGLLVVFALSVLFFKRKYPIIFLLLIGIVIGGGLSNFGLLLINQKNTEISETEIFEIIESGNLARGRKGTCSPPYVYIDFYGTKKQLIVYCEYEKTIKNFS